MIIPTLTSIGYAMGPPSGSEGGNPIMAFLPLIIIFILYISILYYHAIRPRLKEKYASLKIKKEEERRKREQEKQRQAELKRNQDNADFLEKATKDIREYARAIMDKLATIQGRPSPSGVAPNKDIFFDKKIQRLVADKQSIRYSSSPEIENGLKKLTMEAMDMDQNIQSVLESVNRLKQEIASVRQLQQPRDDYVENQLKFYEELISPIEVKSLIVDYRFEDYHEIAKKIFTGVGMLKFDILFSASLRSSHFSEKQP